MIYGKYLAASVIYSLLGIIILLVSFKLAEILTLQKLWQQIVQHKNVALALMAGAFMIAVAIIISSAIHG